MAFGIELGLPIEGRVARGNPRGKRNAACDHGIGLITVGTGNRNLDAAGPSPVGPVGIALGLLERDVELKHVDSRYLHLAPLSFGPEGKELVGMHPGLFWSFRLPAPERL